MTYFGSLVSVCHCVSFQNQFKRFQVFIYLFLQELH